MELCHPHYKLSFCTIRMSSYHSVNLWSTVQKLPFCFIITESWSWNQWPTIVLNKHFGQKISWIGIRVCQSSKSSGSFEVTKWSPWIDYGGCQNDQWKVFHQLSQARVECNGFTVGISLCRSGTCYIRSTLY